MAKKAKIDRGNCWEGPKAIVGMVLHGRRSTGETIGRCTSLANTIKKLMLGPKKELLV